LQVYIAKMTGATLPIRTEHGEADVRIYVGQSRYTDALGIHGGDLRHGAFRRVSGPQHLVLIGRDRPYQPPPFSARDRNDLDRAQQAWQAATGEPWGLPYGSLYKGYNEELGIWEKDERGSYNAVIHFLRGLGVRWYMPHELGEVVPRRDTIELPEVDETVSPDFPVRWPHQYQRIFGGRWTTRKEALWHWRMGWNQAPDIMGWSFGAHGLDNVTSDDSFKAAHPEYYALYGGERCTGFRRGGKPCLSSPGLFDATLRYCRDMFDIMGSPMVSVMPADALTSLCQCPLCAGKDTPQRGWRGLLSDYVWDFVNRVAVELYKTHPDHKVTCASYGSYRLPPEKIAEFSPNVVVRLNQHRNTFNDPAARADRTEFLDSWLEKLPAGERSIIATGPVRPEHPYPAFFPHGIAWNIKSLKDVALGEVMEVTRDRQEGVGRMAAMHLNLYAMSRLWWDAGLDVDELLDEYYRLFYGPAAAEMKRFIEYSENNWSDMSRDAEKIDAAFALIAQAQLAADAGSVYAERIDLVAQFIEPLKEVKAKLARGRQNLPPVEATVFAGVELELDGKLDEDVWSACPALAMREIVTEEPPAHAVTAKLFWDDQAEALYLGFRCEEDNPDSLAIGTRKEDDPAIWNGDYVEVLLETYAHVYYQITVNPAGVMADLDRNDGNKELRWSSGARAAAHIGDGFWSVELRIPITSDEQAELTPLDGVAGGKPTRERPWHINACRVRPRDDSHEAAVLSSTGKGRRGFHDVTTFALFYVKSE
ncbi:MAG: DUF4838 domain-containing protein, partial [Lentisphaerae bacterium]|nr:DUF4838 domain-containing protein [Lentisphaerota bacterium]